MRWKSDVLIEKIAITSRRVFLLCFGLFFSGGGIFAFAEPYHLKWLEGMAAALFLTSLLLLMIIWGMPGIFVLLGVPWLAHAWFRGMNPYWYSPAPWDRMSMRAKVSTYLQSIILFALLIFEIVIVIQSGRQR